MSSKTQTICRVFIGLFQSQLEASFISIGKGGYHKSKNQAKVDKKRICSPWSGRSPIMMNYFRKNQFQQMQKDD